jgi:hypothetical protein
MALPGAFSASPAPFLNAMEMHHLSVIRRGLVSLMLFFFLYILLSPFLLPLLLLLLLLSSLLHLSRVVVIHDR